MFDGLLRKLARLIGISLGLACLTGAAQLLPTEDGLSGRGHGLGSALRAQQTTPSTDQTAESRAISRRVEALKAIARHEIANDVPTDVTRRSSVKSSALLTLGLLHYHGIAVERDVPLARELFLRARKLGAKAANIPVAWCLIDGCGVEPNRRALPSVLRRVAQINQGRHAYLEYLRDKSFTQIGGSELTRESRDQLAYAVRLNDMHALNESGLIALQEKNLTQAKSFFERAAKLGSADGEHNSALLAGQITIADANEHGGSALGANELLGSASSLFDSARQYHRNGRGAVDYGKALTLYRAAAAKGSAAARQMLALILSRPLPGGTVDPVWMRQTSQVNVSAAGPVGTDVKSTFRGVESPIVDLIPPVFRE